MNFNKLSRKIINKLGLSEEQKKEVINGVDLELKRIKGMSNKELKEELKKCQNEVKNGNND